MPEASVAFLVLGAFCNLQHQADVRLQKVATLDVHSHRVFDKVGIEEERTADDMHPVLCIHAIDTWGSHELQESIPVILEVD